MVPGTFSGPPYNSVEGDGILRKALKMLHSTNWFYCVGFGDREVIANPGCPHGGDAAGGCMDERGIG
jgi:hypothetical protein